MNEDSENSTITKQCALRAAIEVGLKEVKRGEFLDAQDVFERLERRAQEIEASARRNAPSG